MKLPLFVVSILFVPGTCDGALFSWFGGDNEDENETVEPLELSERLLRLSKIAIDLSSLAFHSPIDVAEAGYNDFWIFFEDEPEQAIVAAVDGYCFAAFRGSIASIEDWYYNLVPGTTPVCNNAEEVCCNVRAGFHESYNSVFRSDLDASIQECIANYASCDEDSCLIYTGFSSGGAIAHVASLYQAHLKPRLITFGQPPTVQREGCNLLPSERIYRWVNTYNNYLGQGLYAYDIVAGAPLYPEVGQFGHMIVLPPDNTAGVAYFGLDPPDWQVQPGSVTAHYHEDLIWNPEFHPGYREHLAYLAMNVTEYPFILNGFVDGSLCKLDRECQSGRCQRRMFAASKECN